MSNRPIKRFGRVVQLVIETPAAELPRNADPATTTTTQDADATVQPVPADMIEVEESGARWDDYRMFYIDTAGLPAHTTHIRVDGDDYKVTQIAQWPRYARVVGRRTTRT